VLKSSIPRAGKDGLLVSNDEMRDHIFQLLAPKYFYKWKQRHQVKYTFLWPEYEAPPMVSCTYPPPFTTCLQQLSCGSWVFPVAGEKEWLCVRPVSVQPPTA
jgi:proteinaceous RNase P